MRFFLVLSFLLISSAAHAAYQDEPGAKLRWLDKVTARSGVVELHNDESAKYGDLVIRVKACRVQDPLEGADSAAFLQIWETKKDEDPQWVYSGWMFASSPGIAAMDHPVYDVWVLGCLGRPNAPAQSTEAQAESLPAADEDKPVQEEATPVEDGDAAPDEAPATADTEAAPNDEEAAQDGDVSEQTAPATATDSEAAPDETPAATSDNPDDAPYQPPAKTDSPPAPATSESNWDAPFNGYAHTR